MNLRPLLLMMLFCTGCAGPALAAADAAADDLVIPENRIEPGRGDESWKPLFAELGNPRQLFATFTEYRHLPIKKVPVVFKGEVRMLPERGLSLHYLSPEVRTLVIDEKGLLMRDEEGRSRPGPTDARAEAATGALLHVMRFDLAELAKLFHLYGVREGDQWTFVFDPRTPELARSLPRLVVRGDKAVLRRIGLRRSPLQRVEIVIEEVTENAAFTPDDLKRFFR